MSDYQRQSKFVSSLRLDATALMDRVEIIFADADEYTGLGGQTFFNQYFLDAAEDPPVNEATPGITEAEFNAAKAAIVALKAIDWSALYKIKG